MTMLQELVRRMISPEVAKIAALATLVVAVVVCGIDSLLAFFSDNQTVMHSAIDSWIANVSFAYFAALLVHWCLIFRSGEPAWVSVAIARCGVGISVLCFLAALATGHLSLAITVACICNAAFVCLIEAVDRERVFQSQSFIAPLCVFASVCVALYVARIEQARMRVEQLAKQDFQKKEEAIDSLVKDTVTSSPSNGEIAAERTTSNSAKVSIFNADASELNGTHRMGPVKAAARLVFYCDYENENCRRYFPILEQVTKQFGDSVSLTVRHFPAAANGAVPLEGLAQPTACRHALIAEAASRVSGEEGFWKQHTWLLKADPNDKKLDVTAADAIGLADASAFKKAVCDPKTVSRIIEDVVEARARGITGAPALLLNGQRLSRLDEAFVSTAINEVLKKGKPESSLPEQELAKAIDSRADSFPPEQQISAVLSCVRVENPTDRSGGSGVVFAVRGSFVYVLTAAHIVKNARSVEVQTFSKDKFPVPAKTYSWSAVVASSAVSDVAVVRFSSKETAPAPLRLAPHSLALEDESLECITVGCDEVKSPPTCKATRILAEKRVKRVPTEPESLMWETETSSAEGRSGGPILDQENHILGVASGNSNGKGYFSHLKNVYRLLSDNGLLNLVALESLEN